LTSGALPTPKGRTPQCLQKKCSFRLVLNRYLVSSDSPERRRNASGFTTAGQNRFREQIEQLHLYVAALTSMSASKRTAPQWQLPLYVFSIFQSSPSFSMRPNVDTLVMSCTTRLTNLAGLVRRRIQFDCSLIELAFCCERSNRMRPRRGRDTIPVRLQQCLVSQFRCKADPTTGAAHGPIAEHCS